MLTVALSQLPFVGVCRTIYDAWLALFFFFEVSLKCCECVCVCVENGRRQSSAMPRKVAFSFAHCHHRAIARFAEKKMKSKNETEKVSEWTKTNAYLHTTYFRLKLNQARLWTTETTTTTTTTITTTTERWSKPRVQCFVFTWFRFKCCTLTYRIRFGFCYLFVHFYLSVSFYLCCSIFFLLFVLLSFHFCRLL